MPASQVMRMSGVGLKMLQVDKTAIAELHRCGDTTTLSHC